MLGLPDAMGGSEMRYVIVAILAALIGAGLEFERGKSDIQAASDTGYGCGRHDAMQTASSDPADYDLPPCDEVRRKWLWGERWPK